MGRDQAGRSAEDGERSGSRANISPFITATSMLTYSTAGIPKSLSSVTLTLLLVTDTRLSVTDTLLSESVTDTLRGGGRWVVGGGHPLRLVSDCGPHSLY